MAAKRVLVVDIGGNNIKLRASGRTRLLKIPSGRRLTPKRMIKLVLAATADWKYDVISIGYPGQVRKNRPASDPVNLAKGWVGVDYEGAFGRPVRIINDAAMQALGSYRGGRMLFLGLGTGLGAAMIVDGVLAPLELGHLPYKNGRTYEDYVGEHGRRRSGNHKWRRTVADVVERFTEALQPEYIVIGGGNVRRLESLPPGVRRGANTNAFRGGQLLWERSSE